MVLFFVLEWFSQLFEKVDFESDIASLGSNFGRDWPVSLVSSYLF